MRSHGPRVRKVGMFHYLTSAGMSGLGIVAGEEDCWAAQVLHTRGRRFR